MTILFLGDVALGGSRGLSLDVSTSSVIANIEGPVVDDQTPHSFPGPYSTFSGLSDFFESRLLLATLENNHSWDLGADGRQATEARLRALSAHLVDDVTGNRTPSVILPWNELRIGVLVGAAADTFGSASSVEAASASGAIVGIDSLLETMGELQPRVDRLVVLLHWGEEWVQTPSPEQIRIGRALAEAGADLVIGHHAHVPQSWERHHSRLIAYGLGTVELRFPAAGDAHPALPRDGGRRPWWSERSLSVEWEPTTNEARLLALRWRNGTLTAGGAPKQSWRHTRYLQRPTTDRYKRLARQEYFVAKVRNALFARTIPRPRHLVSIAKVLGESRKLGN